MTLRSCATFDCYRKVRTGLRRHGTGANGQDLADGVYCCACRARRRANEKAELREEREKAKERQRVK